MAKLEPEIGRLDKELADPNLYSRDAGRAANLAKKRSDLGEAFAQAEELWIETSERLAEAEATA